MKNKMHVLGILLALSMLIRTGAQNKPPQPQDNVDQARTDQTQRESFIRRDLLRDPAQGEDLQPPLRNIFSPRRPGSPGAGVDTTGTDSAATEAGGQEEEIAAAEEEYYEAIDIRYVGHIRSQARTVALILLGGEAMAVKAGEIVAEGVRILKITPTEIQYEGPDSQTKTVSLEGEDR